SDRGTADEQAGYRPEARRSEGVERCDVSAGKSRRRIARDRSRDVGERDRSQVQGRVIRTTPNPRLASWECHTLVWFLPRGATERPGSYEQELSALRSKQLWKVWPLMVTSAVILRKSNASCSLKTDVDEPSTVLVTTTSSKV